MRSVNFDNPYLLLLAIPLLLLVIIPFVIAIRKENRQKSAVASLILHIVIVCLVTLAAAGTKITTVLTETTVYVVADVSYSSERELDRVDGYIKEMSENLPKNTKLGVVCFGGDSVLLYEAGEEPKSVKDAVVDKSATDIAAALKETSLLFKDDVIKKMVLISDGKSTDENSRGALISAMESLEQKNISLDAIFINSTIEESEREVQISDIEATQKTYLDVESEAKLLLQSSYEGQVKVTLYVKAPDSEEYVAKPFTVERVTYGYNMIKIPLETSEAGVYSYRVDISPESDICDENNSFVFTQEIDPEIDILLVTEKQDDIDALTALYGERASVNAVLVRPGKPLTNLPYTVEELSAYDEIIISNVDIRALPNVTSFLHAVEIVVSQLGKNLTTMGNLEIQNKDDKNLGALSDMLAVSYGNQNSDVKMYTLVLDTSHSMNQAYKFRAMKEAAKSLLSLLADDDMVAVITFSGDVKTLQPPVRVGDKRNQIAELIDGLQPEQGTFLGTAMARASSIMQSYDYKEKQVMIITDGKTNEYDKNPLQVARELRAFGIVASTINISTPDETSIALLEKIAQTSGGNYFYLEDVDEVEELIFAEVADEVTEVIIEKDTPVHIEKMKDSLLSGYTGAQDDILSVPNVQGYIQTSAKVDANVVLSVDYEKESATVRVPLYAWREYGNGRVATLATNPSGGWISGWDDEFKSLFFGNMVKSNLSEEKIDFPFEITTEDRGTTSHITVNPSSLRADGVVTMVVTMPNGEVSEPITLTFDTQKYFTELDITERGTYKLSFNYSYDENRDGIDATVYKTVSYEPEYDMFESYSASSLHSFVSGSVREEGGIIIESDEDDLATYEYSFVIPFMIASLVIFVCDVAIRVIKLKKKAKDGARANERREVR